MPRISGAIITYNEEKCIRRALENLSRFCDEIILVDSYSTDSTLRIAKDYDVNLYQNPFLCHRDQKNYAIERCKNEWIFLLDADEYCSNGLINSLLTDSCLEDLNENRIDAVGIPRYNLEDGIGPRGWPDIQTRLFKNYIRHGGHPIHHSTTVNAKHSIILSYSEDPSTNMVIFHDKTLEQQKERNRMYYYMRPGDYKTIPEGAEDLVVPLENYSDRTNINVYDEYIKRSL